MARTNLTRSLVLTKADEQLIPPHVRALYAAGVIDKKELDSYIGKVAADNDVAYKANFQPGMLQPPAPKEEQAQPEQTGTSYGALSTVQDVATGVGTGVVQGVTGLANLAAQGVGKYNELYGAALTAIGNPTGEFYSELGKTYADTASRELGAYRESLQSRAGELKSEGLLESENALGQLMSSPEFESKSLTDQAKEILKFTGQNKRLIPYMASESVGSLASGGPLSRAAGIIRGSGLGSQIAARAVSGGILGGQELAGIQADVYNQVFQSTGDAEKAREAAATASTDPFVLAAASIDVLTGAEATSLLTGAQKAAQRTTRKTLTGAMAAAAKGAIAEPIGEGLQEGAQRRAENLALGRNEMAGVGGAAALGALVGLPTGAGMASVSQVQENIQGNKSVDARANLGKSAFAQAQQAFQSGIINENDLITERQRLAAALQIEPELIADNKSIADLTVRRNQSDLRKITDSVANELVQPTGDASFDAGQQSAINLSNSQPVTFEVPLKAPVSPNSERSQEGLYEGSGFNVTLPVEAPVRSERDRIVEEIKAQQPVAANVLSGQDVKALEKEDIRLRNEIASLESKRGLVGADPTFNVEREITMLSQRREGIRQTLEQSRQAKTAQNRIGNLTKRLEKTKEVTPTFAQNFNAPQPTATVTAEGASVQTGQVTPTPTNVQVTTEPKKRVNLTEAQKERTRKVTEIAAQELYARGADVTDQAVKTRAQELLADKEQDVGKIEARIADEVRLLDKRNGKGRVPLTNLVKQTEAAVAKDVEKRSADVAEAAKDLTKFLSQEDTDNLIKSGVVTLKPTIKDEKGANVQGETYRGKFDINVESIKYENKNGKLVARNPKARQALLEAVASHEGGHLRDFGTKGEKKVALLANLVGDAAIDKLNSVIEAESKKQGGLGDIARNALERANKQTDNPAREEIANYFTEELTRRGYEGRLGPVWKAMDEMIAGARDNFSKVTGKTLDIRLKDLGYIAKQELKQAAKRGVEQSSDTTKKKSVVYPVASERAREEIKAGKGIIDPIYNKKAVEVSDRDATLNPEKITSGATLGDVMNHDELYSYLPKMKGYTVTVNNDLEAGTARYDSYNKEVIISGKDVRVLNKAAQTENGKNSAFYKNKEKDVLKSILHEFQHGIQASAIADERGTNQQKETDLYNKRTILTQQMDINKAHRELRADNASWWMYLANAGEVQARAIENVFDGTYDTYTEAAEALSKQFPRLIRNAKDRDAFIDWWNKEVKGSEDERGLRLRSIAEEDSPKTKQSYTININGVNRPTVNANGQRIAETDEQIRNFWQWFGDSKAVDSDGKPLVVYHGTSSNFDAFRADGLGIWFTENPEEAAWYAEKMSQGESPTVIPVYLKAVDTRIFDAKGQKYNRLYQILNDRETLVLDSFADGKDSVIFNNIRDPEKITNVFVVRNPEQIKSINNQGTFDPNDSRILRSISEEDSPKTKQSYTININGVNRPTVNANGQRIAETDEQIRNFWQWFGDSKAVDSDGKPLVMYHGTNRSTNGQPFESFDTYGSNYGLFGQGSYFTDNPSVASSYTSKGKGDTPTVYPVYLKVVSPIDMDKKANKSAWQEQFPASTDYHEGGDTNESWYRAAEDSLRDEGLPRYEGAEIIQDGIRSMGYDGITHIGGGRIRENSVEHRVFIIFEPEQVKSAIGNRGAFDPNDSRILRSISEEDSPKSRQTYSITNLTSKMSNKNYQGLREQLYTRMKSGEITSDEYFNQILDLASDENKKKISAEKSSVLKSVTPVFEGITRIPDGTKVIATHGLEYREPTRGTVVGARFIKSAGEGKWFPVVDFGDGKGRTVLPLDIIEVFMPRVKFSLADEETNPVTKPSYTFTQPLTKIGKGLFGTNRPAEARIAEEAEGGYIRRKQEEALNIVNGLKQAMRSQGLSQAQVDEEWNRMNLTQTDSSEDEFGNVALALNDLRKLIDDLSWKIIDIYEQSGIPVSEKNRKGIEANIGGYISRSFDINFDKNYGKKLLKKAAVEGSVEERIVEDLEGWLQTNIVDSLNNLDSLSDAEIDSLYKKLIGETKDTLGKLNKRIKEKTEGVENTGFKDEQNALKKSAEKLEGKRVALRTAKQQELENFRGFVSDESLTKTLRDDLLRIGKKSNLASYYAGASRNEGILKYKEMIPEIILKAWGERTGAVESALTTIMRQSKLVASTQFQMDLLARSPDSFGEARTETLNAQLSKDKGKYGPLAGMYVTPEMKTYLESHAVIQEELDTLLYQLHTNAGQEALATKTFKALFKKWEQAGSLYKATTVLGNPANYAYNIIALGQNAVSNALPTRDLSYTDTNGEKQSTAQWMRQFLGDVASGTISSKTGEVYRDAIEFDFLGAGLSGDLRDAFQKDVRQFMAQTSTANQAVDKVVSSLKTGRDVMFTLPELFGTIANFVNEQNYLRKLWTAEGREFTERELKLEAADRTKKTSMNRGRAFPVAKLLDRTQLTTFLTFFAETGRATVGGFLTGIGDMRHASDLRSQGKTEAADLAFKQGSMRVAGGLAMFGLTQAMLAGLAKVLGHKYGEEEDEKEEYLPEDQRANLPWLVVVGETKEGTKKVFDESKLDTYSALSNPIVSLLRGEPANAASQVSDLAFVNPLLSMAYKQFVAGEVRNRENTAWVNELAAMTGLANVVDAKTLDALANVAVGVTPPVIKRSLTEAMSPTEDIGGQMARALTYAGSYLLEVNPKTQYPGALNRVKTELEAARQELNRVMTKENISEEAARTYIRKYHNRLKEIVDKESPLIQGAVGAGINKKDIKQLATGIDKGVQESLFTGIYKPKEMSKSWLNLSELNKEATKPEDKIKIAQRYKRNKDLYEKLFNEMYGGNK